MYTLYKTEGIVLESADTGESNKYISILTKDFGFIKALARSAREEKSKLRYSLQDLSYINTSLVRGRDIWRITGAKEHYNLYRELSGEMDKLRMLIRVFALLKRLLHGEEKNESLFLTVVNGIDFARGNRLDGDSLINVEYIVVLRILAELGYVAKKSAFDSLLSSSAITHSTIAGLFPIRDSALIAINRALAESQL
jgi:DNA repair protein RecO (recombination protein O)